MGNKHKKNKNKKQNKEKLNSILKRENLPIVSLCTPTFNRRPFIKQCIQNILNQTYPLEKIEWIIIDDGTDKVGDLFKDVSLVDIKYISYDEKMNLGKKRNLLHKESKGDILIYIDDDDYYPPERVMHSVTELLKSKKLIAGSSELYIWFKEHPIYKFGPYGLNHATAGTFAFKKELLNMSEYLEDACFAEEKKFLHNYTIPLIQLDPVKTILVFNHSHNTIDKEGFIKNPTKFVKKTDYDIHKFIKDEKTIDFYTNELHSLLKGYDLGLPKNKPDLINALKERNLLNEHNGKASFNNNSDSKIIVKDGDGNSKTITPNELVKVTQSLQREVKQLKETIALQQAKMFEMSKLLDEYKNKN